MIEKTYLACGAADKSFEKTELEELFSGALSKALAENKSSAPVIIVPPDITRLHSGAGFLTEIAAKQLGGKLGAVLPALGTHTPMSEAEISRMFGETSKSLFHAHNWRKDTVELGRLETDFVEKVTEGAVNFDWPVQVNKLLGAGSNNFSMAISIGQVVPHEVAGMANHAKNIFIGTGGKEAIDKSHFAGAVYGMERIMGRTETPVRALFDEGLLRYGSLMPPILWVLTVAGTEKDSGNLVIRGLYIGFGRECFEKAANLAQKIGVNLLNEQVNKAVVYLDPDLYRTTWLGNKAVYRTRMAIEDGGELLILAPGLERFGEDMETDALIRKYGYRSRNEIIAKIGTEKELGRSLSAAAHLIHGSSEGRFTIRCCPGEKLSQKEVESVGYKWGNLEEAMNRYNIKKLAPGWNTLEDKEKIFFVPDPSPGLWAEKRRFK